MGKWARAISSGGATEGFHFSLPGVDDLAGDGYFSDKNGHSGQFRTDVKDFFTFGGATRDSRRRREEARKARIQAEKERKQQENIDRIIALYEQDAKRAERAKRAMENYKGPSMASVEAQPDFMFGLKTGQNTLETGAAGRKQLLSGNAQKALFKFGQDYGHARWQNQYDREFERLKTLAGYGGNAQAGQATAMDSANRLLEDSFMFRQKNGQIPIQNIDPQTMGYYTKGLELGAKALPFLL
jgi:hypothetical protein